MDQNFALSGLPELVFDPVRLAALESYGILDTPPEQDFDDIVQLARQLCGTPVALVSLVAGSRQWFKARVGFDRCETDLDGSVCAHALTEPDLLVIPNLATDPRTKQNSLVTGEPFIQFYAGAPLRTSDGQVLGSLCVIDQRPRPEGLSAARGEALRALARQVVAQLELRRTSSENERIARAREAVIATQRAAAIAQGDLDTILDVIVQGTLRALPQTECSVIALREADELVYHASAGAFVGGIERRTPLRDTLAGACCLSGEAILCPDISADDRANHDMIEDRRTRACIHVPIRRASGVIGVLMLQAARPNAYSDVDLKLSQVLAGTASTALADAALRENERLTGALLRLGDYLRDASTIPEMALVANEIVGQTLGASRAAYGRIDAEAGTITVAPDWHATGQASIAGLHRYADYGDLLGGLLLGQPLIVADTAHDPRTASDIARWRDIDVTAFINLPVRERGRTVAVYLVHDTKPRIWTPPEIAFLQSVADRVDVGVSRLQAEAQQYVLNEEITHRLKNTLAMVLSIATQTLRGVPDRAPVEAFEQRIHALSTAHNVLMRQTWAAAPMEAVVRDVLKAAGHGERIAMSGPAITLGPRATLSLSLLLHELATNAAKYGALSVQTGHVVAEWRVEGEDEARELVLDWIERGGPPAVTPAQQTRKGFGSRLIRMGLTGTGGVDLRFTPSGLEATMRAHLAELQQGSG